MDEPFTPRDGTAKWRRVYDHAVTLQPGDLITYQQLTDILGYNPSDLGQSRSPIYLASKRMLNEHNRTLVAVPNKGYRIAHANEHEGLARHGQRAARRRLTRAVEISTHVDVTALDPAQRRSLETLAHVLAAQNAMLARHDTRIGHVEKDVRRVDDRIAAIEASLAARGIDVPAVKVIAGELAEPEGA